MLKVIGAGFPRTGTTSTKAALERLGFGPCHHMFEVMTHPEQVDRLLPVASGATLDWDHVLEGYNSTQDWPASYFWREQAAAYPDAKVLLTVRDPASWYRSMGRLLDLGPRRLAEEHGTDLPAEPPEGMPEIFRNMMRLRPVLDHIVAGTFGAGHSFAEGLPPEDAAVEVFLRHQETVRAALPAERLLV
ncbi:MAG: sulfotransferase family protein, partial [Micromonosporaceae bacterium]